jgi:histidinol-phosphate aminotransferase
LAERKFLENMLQEIVWVERIYPSDANFLLVKVKGAKEIYQYLVDHKIVVRDRSSVVLCDECLRITVGKEEENHRLVNVLKEFVPKIGTKPRL